MINKKLIDSFNEDSLEKVFKNIDEKFIISWANNENFGVFIESLNDKEKKLLMSLKINDCGAERTEKNTNHGIEVTNRQINISFGLSEDIDIL
jgi:hypothetical protein